MPDSVPRDHMLVANGCRFRLREWGGEGQPIVLLHGLASTCRIWDLAAPLLRRYGRVVALDQRGHGESEQPARGYSFNDVGEDLRALLQALAVQRPILVGHSWGGNVVLHYAASYPREAAGIVLVDGGFLELSSAMSWEQAERELAPPALAGMALGEFRRRLREEWMRELWSPQREACILAGFRIERESIYPRLPRHIHMHILHELWSQRPAELYALVQCPALLIPAEPPQSGAQQRLQQVKAAAVQRALSAMPAARLVWFRDTLHDIPLYRSRELAETIGAWLRSDVVTHPAAPREL